ncbi:hypothetical protein DL768_010351 [Monosporascus sp. mg162]|nr:hypothetical protein DL768_010351 [Monosporascus sp. mg162]
MLPGAGVLTGAVTVADLRMTLEAGFTSIRELSVPAILALVGRAVAAHAIDKAGTLAAVRAGGKSIEHWCYLDEEVADMMRAKGSILVATRHIQEGLLAGSRELPPKVI